MLELYGASRVAILLTRYVLWGTVVLAASATWNAAAQEPARTAYAAEIWPFRVERVGERLDYHFDLTAVKGGAVSADWAAEVEPSQRAAFLRNLPKTVRASVALDGAVVTLSAPGGLERAPLSPSFSAVKRGEPAKETTIPVGPRRLKTPLDPEVAKVLVSLDVVLWKVKELEDSAAAALELQAEQGGKGLPMGAAAFWTAVAERAVRQQSEATGDARDGAALLVARLAAAGCLRPGWAPPESLTELVAAEQAALSASPGRWLARGFYRWRPELGCAWNRSQALGMPLPRSRAGIAAALTFLAILDGHPKLGRAYRGLEGVRDSLWGKPRESALDLYRTVAGPSGARAAIDELGVFLEKLAVAQGAGGEAPALLALPDSERLRFLRGLVASERSHASDELALALQEGRVGAPVRPNAPWSELRTSARMPLLRPEVDGGLSRHLVAEESYLSRLLALYHPLEGAHRGVELGLSPLVPGAEASESSEAPAGSPVTPRFKLRLRIPPHLELEPLPAAFGRARASVERLLELLESFPGGTSLRGLAPDGRPRARSLSEEARGMAQLLRGLEKVAEGTVGPGERPWTWKASDRQALQAARAFLSQWRKDGELARDVRGVDRALPAAAGDDAFVAVLGVGRRELRASFSEPPKVTVPGFSGDDSPFEPDSTAPQSYLLPVLVTGEASVAGGQAPDDKPFRALCDELGGLSESIEAALPGALSTKRERLGD